jgi:hypothetical protein
MLLLREGGCDQNATESSSIARGKAGEGENTGPVYRRHLQTVIHNSYRSHYRRRLPLALHARGERTGARAALLG